MFQVRIPYRMQSSTCDLFNELYILSV